MKLNNVAVYFLALPSLNSIAQDQTAFKKLSGSYSIHDGELGDTSPPTAQDKKLAIELDKQSSKNMFDAIGPYRTGGEFLSTRRPVFASDIKHSHAVLRIQSGLLCGQAFS
ncbi:hypothetical protein RGU70_16800 [Herbaspirillum sp. RTI4]|uniref:hypothetical protein n=1 Tax=Herbaspirillum sp. RTI4 TaxID=3048640 RepID=UPI002AB4A48F|nr:hypothetical protein [Herbaspirillum sp. RTI4]MDY7579974.1 hypothetical protein [Herbaspirillum sp. RTI4]MEA9982882.1 hypothetical protein [Herbaspirillum sp. RTI4]